MASGVTKVIARCDEAVETKNLDLSECQLTQMPDAVFHLMRNTELCGCNLSCNVIKNIPAKLALKFVNITELNLSHNRLGRLPEEFKELQVLAKLDISNNLFLAMPNAIYSLKLKQLEAKKNFIADVQVERLRGMSSLEMLDLRENPLNEKHHEDLSKVQGLQILFTEIKIEEYEIIPTSGEHETEQ